MSSLSPYTHESMDNSLALFSASLEKLKAAQSVDIEEVTEQFKTAAEAARNLRSLVAAELPAATWQSRQEFDALVTRIHGMLAARSRLLSLATVLEGGRIVHRRALRVAQINELREQAIIELHSLAQPGAELPTLPGPAADQWIEWACGLKEPEDAESLQTLRDGFANLDTFVANLEPDMWVVTTETAVLRA